MKVAVLLFLCNITSANCTAERPDLPVYVQTSFCPSVIQAAIAYPQYRVVKIQCAIGRPQ